MAHVSVTINGRSFRMACDDGQEDHLLRLAAEVNGKVDQLKGAFGEIGDTRLTVMAAIMVADELADTRRRLKAAETELAALREARAVIVERADQREALLAHTLDDAASSIERLTSQLTGLTKPVS
ncbi:cell division protein ZapA [Phreatobacter cathodiphilus]|uniref:Cell division protein ZapA n=1 Tax=Phreatobacter cathodiphilus TaxID=1868589 RepID=A0A2S0N896_9HYPH|nr:cell division protein ZapA [Phreatobacter cathodiphilus]AVO44237.1 cell division protein ZapA [Phreatobacter cathodiphilus]